MEVVVGADGVARCWWGASTADDAAYHDDEWGRAITEDRLLFEKLCLEGFQAGLSWLTILRKRPAFQRAFAGFDFSRVARFDAEDVERLANDAEIVRHRGKIRSSINNAQRALELVAEEGSLTGFFWQWADRSDEAPTHIAPTTEASVALAHELKRRGWTFVGPTTVYAFMQAVGLVNDHLSGCHARDRCIRERQAAFGHG